MRRSIRVTEQAADQPLAAYQVYVLQARTLHSLRGELEARLAKYELSLQEWLLLSAIRDAGKQEVPMRALASIMHLSLPRTTTVSKRLIKRKLVRQKAGRIDFRTKRLQCTLGGKRLIDTVNRELDEALNDWRSPLVVDRFNSYLRLLEELAK